MARKLYCTGCGEYLGEAGPSSYFGEIHSCGEPECDRECRDAERQERNERMWDAQEDDYRRY